MPNRGKERIALDIESHPERELLLAMVHVRRELSADDAGRRRG